MPRLSVHGKHLFLDGERIFLRLVTYGPYPEDCGLETKTELQKITAAKFHGIRTYGLPERDLLDLAAQLNLIIMPTLAWGHGCDFFAQPMLYRTAEQQLEDWLRKYRDHPALGAVLVGNEIPSDMARWMGPERVRAKLDQLIGASHRVAPQIPVAYASYPTTEYLEPTDADFTAINLYLEDESVLKSYLPRLHHLAGDRPVLITEFGLDTHHNSETQQAELLPRALSICHQAGMAGFTLYAWSDHWKNNGKTVTDWSFGLNRRDHSPKPALHQVIAWTPEHNLQQPRFSVIICTRNGEERLTECLNAIAHLDYENFQTLVINDGSSDGTRALLDARKEIEAHHLEACGLSAARNFGATRADGEILAFTDDDCVVDPHWLSELAIAYANSEHAAIGGPNLSPSVSSLSLALTTAAPGAPTHVMLNDTQAEHLPGCHFSVKKSAFDKIGGFDPIFETAGDDVDFCWRLRDANFTLGFRGPSFVWHHRRATVRRYLKQQKGYGQAEAILFKKHPHRFGNSGIRWEGIVYQGSAIGAQNGDFIYSGPAGQGAFQSLALTRQPERGLALGYRYGRARAALHLLSFFAQWLRRHERKKHGGPNHDKVMPWKRAINAPIENTHTLAHPWGKGRSELYHLLQSRGWEPCDESDWDLQLGKERIFAATELIPDKKRRTFIRHSGTINGFAKVKQRAEMIGFTPSHAESPHLYISKTK